MDSDIINPPAAHGPALLHGTRKQQASDFCVAEVLDIEFEGAGEHLYLQVEKSSINTDEVLKIIQECYGVGSADVGLCGLKDRHAVSTQWFSIRTPQASDDFEQTAQQFNAQQESLWSEKGGYLKTLRLVHSARHSRKLKRGAHRCNRFVLTLTGIKACKGFESSLKSDVDKRIQTIAAQGFPSYIGAQRFGHGAQNLQRAKQWFARPRKRCSRQQRSLWFSSARSAIFNVVCAARVRDGSWRNLLEGEPAVLDGSRSFFTTGAESEYGASEGSDNGPDYRSDNRTDNRSDNRSDPQAANEPARNTSLDSRIAEFDIHPSAPWWGRGRSPATGICAEFEALQLQPYTDLCEALERGGLNQERRALRARATELTHRWKDEATLELSFSLSPGVFATTLLREIGNTTEPQR